MKKPDLPTFMLAHNPLKDGSYYVVHSKEPYFVAEVHEFEKQEDSLEFEAKHSLGGRAIYQGKYYVLIPQLMIRTEIDEKDALMKADKYAKLMRRAADWLHAALKILDQNETDIPGK